MTGDRQAIIYTLALTAEPTSFAATGVWHIKTCTQLRAVDAPRTASALRIVPIAPRSLASHNCTPLAKPQLSHPLLPHKPAKAGVCITMDKRGEMKKHVRVQSLSLLSTVFHPSNAPLGWSLEIGGAKSVSRLASRRPPGAPSPHPTPFISRRIDIDPAQAPQRRWVNNY
jgi:hypothetical protein